MTFQPSQEPTGDEAIAYLQRCAREIEAYGWSTEDVADFLLRAAYNIHAEAQGAPDMIGWRDRANRRFLFSVGFFCVGVAKVPMTPDEGAVLLPMRDVPPIGPRATRRRLPRSKP